MNQAPFVVLEYTFFPVILGILLKNNEMNYLIKEIYKKLEYGKGNPKFTDLCPPAGQ